MPEERSAPPLRGDEEHLFTEYADRVLRDTRARLITSRANVEDACAFAWSQLIRTQPERDNILSWLRTVAFHQALRLQYNQRDLGVDDITEFADVLPDQRDPIRGVDALLEARDALEPLTQRERSAVLL